MNPRKVLKKALGGAKNIRFEEPVGLIEAFGFRLARTSGSHHIFEHPTVTELVNIQNWRGMAKLYQVRQLLKIVEDHDLRLEDEA